MAYFKLIKDGKVWDYFDHNEDVGKYVAKILWEEPTAMLEVVPATKRQYKHWKTS